MIGRTWKHMELPGEISVALPGTLQRLRRCRYPLCFTSAIFAEIFGLWRVICTRRMELNN